MNPLNIRTSSAWTKAQIEDYLRTIEIPVRLGSISNGAPLVSSLWYLYEDGAIWCATRPDARLIHWLEDSPRCAFEVAGDNMPYKGVRGQGTAILDAAAGEFMLLRLIDRYLHDRESDFARWLISRSEGEVAICIRPDWVNSWDFSGRMK
ncbi:MAG: pyridoxamine 5'-phosphate oxidase family protein [Gammaproteobacteria bacterium]|nr:pyridoxamine 5'-phosphate oxidase family protein [Gammaproteobacteria bacterium]